MPVLKMVSSDLEAIGTTIEPVMDNILELKNKLEETIEANAESHCKINNILDNLKLFYHWQPLEMRRETQAITINGYEVYKEVKTIANEAAYFDYKFDKHYTSWSDIERFFDDPLSDKVPNWKLTGKSGKHKLKENHKTVYKETKHSVDIHYWIEYSKPISIDDTDFSYFDKATTWEKANMISWLCQNMLYKTSIKKG